jgi:hypothetical protein
MSGGKVATSKRRKGTVDSVFYGVEDHGILTMYVGIKFDVGGYQSFGGVCLNETLGPDFKRSVCDAFGVRDMELLKGKRCHALYAFGEHNEPILGLEGPTGKRFIINTWRRKHFPDTNSVLEQKAESQLREIRFLERRLFEERNRLAKLEENYTEWENLK